MDFLLAADDILELSHAVTRSGHFYVDLRDDRLFWSDELFKMHGFDPGGEQPDLQTAISYYHPQERQHVKEMLEHVKRTFEPMNFNSRILHKDGSIRYLRNFCKIKKDDLGAFLFGVCMDVTDDWTEQRHYRRLAKALENTAEAIVMTDPQGLATWVNSAFTRITGYSREEIIGNKPGSLLQGVETDPKTADYMREKIARGEAFATEILNYKRDGAPHWLRISCQPDFDDNGQVVGFIAIQTDITKEKNARLDLAREVESRKLLEQQLRHLAAHDELSGMPNRRHFLQQAEMELNRSRRHQHSLSLLLADLDHFKMINDEFGHAAGDAVIRAFGRLCEQTLREQDVAARVGGEEFAVLLPDTDLEGAHRLAERIRHKLSVTPIVVGDQKIWITVSIGVMEARPDEPSVESMLAKADKALYAAKHAGRNRVSGGG